MSKLFYTLLMLFILFLTGCNADYEGMAERRVQYAEKNRGDIAIAVFQNSNNSSYINGVVLAVEEVNLQGGLLGRNLKLLVEQDGNDFDSIKSTIRRVTSNPKVAAVLGHVASKVVIPASVVYEKSKILFFPPFFTAKGLTAHNFNYIFRMLPKSKVMAAQMANITATLGYKKIVMLLARDEYSRELAFLYEEAAVKLGLKLVVHASLYEKSINYRHVISEFKGREFDAIFLSSPAGPAARMVKQLREMRIDVPIIGIDTLNSDEFRKKVGSAGRKMIVPSVYNANASNFPNQTFRFSYNEKYNKFPDTNAAQGYDSVMLFAEAVNKAQSTVPELLSSTLHYMPASVGVTGIHDFDKTGEIAGKKYFFKTLIGDEWRMVPAIHSPFLLERLVQGLSKKAQGNQKITNFSEAFSKKLHTDDYRKVLLDLSHDILKFKSLGVIYEDSESGRKAADYDLIKQVAKKKGFEVKACKVEFSRSDKTWVEKKLKACYGKLSLWVDVIYLVAYKNVDQSLIRKLNAGLGFFKIPLLTIDRGSQVDPNVSLALDRLTVDLREINTASLFKQLLKGIKVHEFQDRLSALPVISVNIENLQKYDIAIDEILSLSPDSYVSFQEFNAYSLSTQNIK